MNLLTQFLLCLFFALPILGKRANTNNQCRAIDEIFRDAWNKLRVEDGTSPPCQCLLEHLSGVQHNLATRISQQEQQQEASVECTGNKTFELLRSIHLQDNESRISRLRIWSSQISTLSSELFSNFKPSILRIDSSVEKIDEDAFYGISNHVQSLTISKNYLKSFSGAFRQLRNIKSIILSGNQLRELKAGSLDGLKKLETLSLSENELVEIDDGTFSALSSLRSLNLAGNKLKRISRNTFDGLTRLEILDLNGNEILDIHPEAFSQLKSLKELNIAGNNLNRIDIINLPQLVRLFLNNNSLSDKKINLTELPKLAVLNLDFNNISSILDDKQILPSASSRLISLSLSGNKISLIECGAFDHLNSLTILSLQNNQIESLSCQPKIGTLLIQSVFKPLKKLRSLFLSYNQIKVIENGDLNILPTLTELSLDHNQINEMSKDSLEGLQLTKLFLNNNRLYYLPHGIFNGWHTKQIIAIDLDENPWDCICDSEWIGRWLGETGFSSASPKSFGCLIKCMASAKPDRTKEPGGHEFWITVIAAILAVVALIFLSISAYIYFQESCRMIPVISLGRVPSDMIRLIPSQESLLSFPNPIANGELIKPGSYAPVPTISITVNEAIGPATQNKQTSADKKRVRFDDA